MSRLQELQLWTEQRERITPVAAAARRGHEFSALAPNTTVVFLGGQSQSVFHGM